MESNLIHISSRLQRCCVGAVFHYIQRNLVDGDSSESDYGILRVSCACGMHTCCVCAVCAAIQLFIIDDDALQSYAV